MWTVMDAAAREEFLAGVHVGVLTGRGSREVQAIRAVGRFSLCAQGEHPPYRYVSVEGPVFRMRPEHWLSQDQDTGLAARLPAWPARKTAAVKGVSALRGSMRNTSQLHLHLASPRAFAAV